MKMNVEELQECLIHVIFANNHTPKDINCGFEFDKKTITLSIWSESRNNFLYRRNYFYEWEDVNFDEFYKEIDNYTC